MRGMWHVARCTSRTARSTWNLRAATASSHVEEVPKPKSDSEKGTEWEKEGVPLGQATHLINVRRISWKHTGEHLSLHFYPEFHGISQNLCSEIGQPAASFVASHMLFICVCVSECMCVFVCVHWTLTGGKANARAESQCSMIAGQLGKAQKSTSTFGCHLWLRTGHWSLFAVHCSIVTFHWRLHTVTAGM